MIPHCHELDDIEGSMFLLSFISAAHVVLSLLAVATHLICWQPPSVIFSLCRHRKAWWWQLVLAGAACSRGR